VLCQEVLTLSLSRHQGSAKGGVHDAVESIRKREVAENQRLMGEMKKHDVRCPPPLPFRSPRKLDHCLSLTSDQYSIPRLCGLMVRRWRLIGY
jgi:hypothetical protein